MKLNLPALTSCILALSACATDPVAHQRADENNRARTIFFEAAITDPGLKERVKKSGVIAKPLSAEAAASLAEAARDYQFGVMYPYLRRPQYELDLPDAFVQTVSAMLTSPSLAERTAIATYLSNPFKSEALTYFAAQTDAAGSRRYAILAHLVAPGRAIQAYEHASDLQADPFCLLQMAALHYWRGDFSRARQAILTARTLWPDDGRVQAETLRAEVQLADQAGQFEQRREKLLKAYELSKAANDKLSTAATLAVLSDPRVTEGMMEIGAPLYDRKQDGIFFHPPELLSSTKYLEEARALATEIGAYALLNDIDTFLASAKGGFVPGDYNRYMREAMEAAVRSGATWRMVATSKQAVLNLYGNDEDGVRWYAQTLETAGRKVGDLSVIVAAQKMLITQDLDRERWDMADLRIGAWRWIAFVAEPSGTDFMMLEARVQKGRGHAEAACASYGKIQANYRAKGFDAGDAWISQIMTDEQCQNAAARQKTSSRQAH